MSKPWIHVVAALIIKNNSQCLIAKRLVDTHQGNLWEFPGGKVEPGEQAFTALQRELREELDIDIDSAQAFLQIKHAYPDKNIFLDIYKVYEYRGQEKPKASQEIRWVNVCDIKNYAFPKANQRIVDALLLPEFVAITSPEVLQKPVKNIVEQVVKKNINVILFRDYSKNNEQYLNDAIVLNQEFKKKLAGSSQSGINPGLMINRFALMEKYADEFLGLHLNSESLKTFKHRPVAKEKLLSASCHNKEEVALAEKLQCDFIYLAPVLDTTSHPEKTSLGWFLAEQILVQCKLPVILLGGLTMNDLSKAKSIGALGIAGITNFWD